MLLNDEEFMRAWRAALAQIDEEAGGWVSCSGCLEHVEGHAMSEAPFCDLFDCLLGVGCNDCGGLGAVWER